MLKFSPPNVMVLVRGNFERCLSHEGGTSWEYQCLVRTPQSSACPSLPPSEDTVRSLRGDPGDSPHPLCWPWSGLQSPYALCEVISVVHELPGLWYFVAATLIRTRIMPRKWQSTVFALKASDTEFREDQNQGEPRIWVCPWRMSRICVDSKGSSQLF